MRQPAVLGLAVALVVATGLGAWLLSRRVPSTPGQAQVELPDSVEAWKARASTASYDANTIFDYIDGHAEVYLAYGFRRCLARRYQGPAGEADIVADVFELASPADAFGVATYDREGAPAEVGRDGLVRHGWLSFWQGPYFVSVLSERETGRSRAAVLALGRYVAERLPNAGGVPPIVAALPAAGLDTRRVRFLRHPRILETHVFVDDENLLGLGPGTSAALGHYARDGVGAHLLIVDYPGPALARSAARAFGKRFGLPDAGVAAVGDRGWFAARVSEARVAAVIEAGSRDLAAALIHEALGTEGGAP